MSRRRRQGLSPSLFPFLAVLVCTLGTLILLLALVAQNATTAAEQNARAQQQAQARNAVAKPAVHRISRDSAEALLRDEEFRVNELVAIRDQQTSDIESRRDELTHLDDHIERLRQKLRRLNEEVQQATGETQTTPIDETVLSELKKAIDSERQNIEKLREESTDHSPRVVIVPHKGPNGTDRRPVYLECDAEGVTIWPEGSRIPMEQLENAAYSANPLDAALRTVRMHAMQNYGDSVPPYPLLVVRPDGIETYGAARRAMQEWDDQFGYELVPADVKLAFAKPDPNLKRRIDIAINTAAAEQRVRIAMSRRTVGGSGSLSGAGRGGSRNLAKSLPTLSAAALDRAGRANGFSQLRDDYRSQASPSATGSPYAQGPQIGSVSRNGYIGGTSEVTDAGAAARRMAEQMQAAANELRSSDDQSGKAGPAGNTAHQPAELNSPLQDPRADLTGQGEMNRGDSLSTNGFSEVEQRANSAGDWKGEVPGTTSTLQQADNSIGSPSGQEAMKKTTSNSETYSLAPERRPMSADPDAAVGSARSQSNVGSQGAQASSSMQGSQASPSMQGSQASPSMQGSPPPTNRDYRSADPRRAAQLQSTAQPSMTPRADLVRRQGRDWALPESMAGMHGNAIIRTIRLQCYPDRFVLLPPKNNGATEVFGFFSGDVDRATIELATALRDRLDQWGPALPGGRWQPRLEVEVAPHSEMRFHQLRTLLNGSGIEVVGREAP